MRLQEVIRGAKLAVALGQWSSEKLRAKDFALSKKGGRAYPLTRRWRWQIIRFEYCGRQFRVLAAYHTLVPEYLALLAEDVGLDSRVVARWEFHGSHGGWHVHPVCGDFDNSPTGVVKPAGIARLPSPQGHHRRKAFLNSGHVMSDDVATAAACSCFGIPYDEDLYVLGALPWH